MDLRVFTHGLREIAASVWSSIGLGPLELESAPSPPASPHYFSCVDIVGPFEGTLTFECSKSVAESLARAFGSEASVTPELMRLDAMREVSNLVGGGIKSLLPSGCSLGLPRASRTRESLLLTGSEERLAALSARCGNGRLRLELLRSRSSQP